MENNTGRIIKSNPERMKEFIAYRVGPDNSCNNIVLKKWAQMHGLSLQDKYDLSFFFSATYCVPSACILYLEQKKQGILNDAFLDGIKKSLVFQSDRKYMRMKDNLERCYKDYRKTHYSVLSFLRKTATGSKIDLEKAVKEVSKWTMYGRFSAFLFLEAFIGISEAGFVNATIDWKDGETTTSGLLNLFGYDSQAELFDKTGKLPFSASFLDNLLKITVREISKAGASENVTEIETALCAYRKFHKGTRYNGYYIDRMLEELNVMKADFPELCAELFAIRRNNIDVSLLGEVCGWDGIRTELKKKYLLTGEI